MSAGFLVVGHDDRIISRFDDENEFAKAFDAAGANFKPEQIWHLIEQIRGQPMENVEVRQFLKPHCNNIDELFDKWDGSKIKNFELNSTGIAIAHSSLKRHINFDAPIDIWIK